MLHDGIVSGPDILVKVTRANAAFTAASRQVQNKAAHHTTAPGRRWIILNMYDGSQTLCVHPNYVQVGRVEVGCRPLTAMNQ